MDSLFSTRDPAYHSALKKPVAQLFSMTNMKNYEPHADECTAIFLHSMRDLQGTPVDLAIWLQWYAFDVIGNITFQRKFGFMEQRRDVDDMILGLDHGLKYVKVVGQFPDWHRWLVGSKTFREILPKISPIPDTPTKFIKASQSYFNTSVSLIETVDH
jgi:cytochrome P450